MSDVNTKSKRFSFLRKTQESEPEQKWNVHCLCDHDLAGIRKETAQKIVCPHCERVQFILPNNTYPSPKRTKKKRKRREGEPLRKIALRYAGEQIRRVVHILILGSLRKVAAALHSIMTAVLAWFTPLRSAISLLIVIIAFAGFYGYQQQSQAKALQVLREAIVEGEQFLKQGQWGDATEQYHRAAQAVKQLGREDEFAWQVLQKDRELQAIQGLCILSLEAIIDAAAGEGHTTQDWQSEFNTMINNRWLVMESWIRLDAGKEDPDAILSYSMPIGEEKVNFLWPAKLFGPLLQNPPLHVFCAGQIQSVEPAEDPRFDWVVKMRPESAFLWCFEETTEPLGFELDSPWVPEDSLRKVLSRQRALFSGKNKGTIP